MFTVESIAAIHTEARSSFMPRDAQHEYIQLLSVILQYRDGSPPRKNGSIGRDVCRKSIQKARQLKARIAAGETTALIYTDLN